MSIIDVSTMKSVTFEEDSVYKLLKSAAKYLKEHDIVDEEFGTYYGEGVVYECQADSPKRLTLTFNMDVPDQYILPD